MNTSLLTQGLQIKLRLQIVLQTFNWAAPEISILKRLSKFRLKPIHKSGSLKPNQFQLAVNYILAQIN